MGVNLNITRDPSHPDRVLMLVDGRLVAEMPWEVADEVARLLYGAARHAEEYQKANKIIAQNALLIRTGAPFGLSSNLKILEESYKDAQWDTSARKGMPLRGIPSARKTGTPSLIKTKPVGG